MFIRPTEARILDNNYDMKRLIYYIKINLLYNFFFLIIFIFITGCSEAGKKIPNVRNELTISGFDKEHWSYFSFENGSVVGTGKFMSKEDDETWYNRTDWDFAICGNYIKTNSGTSGIGLGGVLRDTVSNFLTLEKAPSEGYLTDSIYVVTDYP